MWLCKYAFMNEPCPHLVYTCLPLHSLTKNESPEKISISCMLQQNKCEKAVISNYISATTCFRFSK